MKKTAFNIALFHLLALSAYAATAVDLPTLDDPELAGWMKSIGEDYTRYLADPQSFFNKPAEAKAWPCNIPLDQLNKLAGTVSLADETPKVKQPYMRSMRPLGADYLKAYYAYQNVRFYPDKAACVKGKLNGETEFWVDFEKVDSTPVLKTVIKFTKRVAFNAVAGERSGLVREYLLEGDTVEITGSPALLDIKKTHKTLEQLVITYSMPERDPAPMVQYRHYLQANDPSGVVRETLTHRPLPNGRMERMQYKGGNKAFMWTLKDNLNHGPQKTYPHMMGTLKIPGSTVCYKEGEIYKADPCDVE